MRGPEKMRSCGCLPVGVMIVCVFWWLSSRVSCPSSVWEFGDKSHFSGFVALLACLPSGEIRCLKDRFPILRLDLLHM